MSSLHAISSAAVGVYRQALAATAQNVANAETPGYIRRTVRLEEIGPLPLGEGAGVMLGGIERAWDGLLASDWRAAVSDAGAAAAHATWSARIEKAVTVRDVGEADSLSTFFASATRLAANPADGTGRSLFLQSLDAVAQEFRTIGSALATEQVGLDDALSSGVNRANALLADLSSTNRALLNERPGTEAHAQLLDRRDAALVGLSAEIEIDVRFEDRGTAMVHAIDGFPLLADSGVSSLFMRDGQVFVRNDTGTVPLEPGGGALSGLLAARADIDASLAGLDSFARAFSGAINLWSAAGSDASGQAGQPLLGGTTAGALALTTHDPASVAAARAGSANGNLLALASLGTEYGEGFADLRSAAALRAAALQQNETRLSERRDAAALALDAVAGVDLDREAADMLGLQQAYGASARILQVANSLLDTIIGLN